MNEQFKKKLPLFRKSFQQSVLVMVIVFKQVLHFRSSSHAGIENGSFEPLRTSIRLKCADTYISVRPLWNFHEPVATNSVFSVFAFHSFVFTLSVAYSAPSVVGFFVKLQLL